MLVVLTLGNHSVSMCTDLNHTRHEQNKDLLS